MKILTSSAILLTVAGIVACQADPPLERASVALPADEERQFDFWLGEWDVQTLDGRAAGKNRISLRNGKRVLLEEWEGVSGTSGTSINLYDRAAQRWHQTWMDDSGLLLLLEGGLREDGSMVMEGKRTPASGSTVLDRVRWTPSEDGRVRQTWESSTDGGAHWQTLADLIYVRRRRP